MIKKGLIFGTLLVLFQSYSQMEEPIVIGHRGAKGHIVENSLPSIEKGIELGSDAIEIDVFKIADGSVVVFHDDTLDRLTKASGSIEKYTKSTLDEVLLEGGVKIPTLEEVLDLIDKRAVLNIELKGAGTAAPVYKIMKKYMADKGWKKEDFIISSFKWDELEEMRGLDNEISIGVLTSKDMIGAMEEAKKVNAVAIHPHFKALTKENVAEAQKEGFKIYTWTVNTPEDIKLVKSLYVDGVITDYPERVN